MRIGGHLRHATTIATATATAIGTGAVTGAVVRALARPVTPVPAGSLATALAV